MSDELSREAYDAMLVSAVSVMEQATGRSYAAWLYGLRSYDAALREQLETAQQNATYMVKDHELAWPVDGDSYLDAMFYLMTGDWEEE